MTVKYDPILDKVREKDTGTGVGAVDSVIRPRHLEDASRNSNRGFP